MLVLTLIMKSTLTVLLGLALVFVACFVAWPKLGDQPKRSQEKFTPMVAKTTHRERTIQEKQTPVKVEFGLRASFDPQPENTETQTNQ